MEIIEVGKEQSLQWDDYMLNTKGSFLQSFSWSEFQEFLGRKVLRLARINEKGELCDCLLVIRMPLLFGYGWLYAPRASFLQDVSIATALLQKIKQSDLAKKTIFFKTDPNFANHNPNRKFLAKIGLEECSDEIQPRNTLMIDITKPEKNLLESMHPKTRYNIKVAIKRGIEVIWSNEERFLDSFLYLINKTKNRKEFKAHNDAYYKGLVRKAGFQIVSAQYNGKIIASNLMKIFGQTAVYAHGAADYEDRSLMAPYLLQWEGIRKAKEKKCVFYDMWGVQWQGSEKKSWAGFTRFKKGFAPDNDIITYVGCFQQIYNPLMNFLYKILKKIK